MMAKGTSLIEVLVASLILASGILCLLTLQASASGIGILSAQRQQASLMLMELAELSRISPQTFSRIDPALIAAVEGDSGLCAVSLACTPVEFFYHELGVWAHHLAQRLPHADFSIEVMEQQGQIVWRVEVSWRGVQDSPQQLLQSELIL